MSDHDYRDEDVEMTESSGDSPTLSPTLHPAGIRGITTPPPEQKAPQHSSCIIDPVSECSSSGNARGSALDRLAAVASASAVIPAESETRETPWQLRRHVHDVYEKESHQERERGSEAEGPTLLEDDPTPAGLSRDIVILSNGAGGGRAGEGEQKVVSIPSPSELRRLDIPIVCEISTVTDYPSTTFSSSPTHHAPSRRILGSILGDLDQGTNPQLSSAGIINPPHGEQQQTSTGEQRNFGPLDFTGDARTKGPLVFPRPGHPGPSLKLPPLSLALSLSQPTPNRRPLAIPAPLSTPGIRSASLGLASPRHSPYAHPSARLTPSSSDALRSARIRLNSGVNMLSPSSFPTSSTPPSRSPALPATPPGQSSSGQSTPLAPTSPSSMSMSKRRRAPEWPSPRTYHSQSQSLSYPSHPLTTGQAPPSAFSRDLAQTIHTPAALRVPPTPDYSPAFYRSGFTGHPPTDLGSPLATQPNFEPLGRNHSPFSSAPALSAPRLADPPSPPLASPMPGSSASAAAKKQRVNLMGIPKGWVIEQLNKRAAQFWHDPSSSDVRILVPIPRSRIPQQAPRQPDFTPHPLPDSAQSFHSNQPAHAVWPTTPLANMVNAGIAEGQDKGLLGHVNSGHASTTGRRGSLPGRDDVVALVFPLHQDYLITQSALFRSLFTPSTPAAHLDASAPSAPRSIKGARRLPTPPGAHPAILLPLPDPASFSVLVHWLYWGDIAALESALSRGLVEWQGVVKNVHYLGMDDNVKRVLGKWWRKWIKTDEGRKRNAAGPSGMRGKEGWADSDEEDEGEEEELQDEEEGSLAGQEGKGKDRRGDWDNRDTEPAREADDGGVSGLLRAL